MRVAARPAIPIVVILVPMLFVLVMPISTPDLVAVTTIVKLSISLPVASICNLESMGLMVSFRHGPDGCTPPSLQVQAKT